MDITNISVYAITADHLVLTAKKGTFDNAGAVIIVAEAGVPQNGGLNVNDTFNVSYTDANGYELTQNNMAFVGVAGGDYTFN